MNLQQLCANGFSVKIKTDKDVKEWDKLLSELRGKVPAITLNGSVEGMSKEGKFPLTLSQYPRGLFVGVEANQTYADEQGYGESFTLLSLKGIIEKGGIECVDTTPISVNSDVELDDSLSDDLLYFTGEVEVKGEEGLQFNLAPNDVVFLDFLTKIVHIQQTVMNGKIKSTTNAEVPLTEIISIESGDKQLIVEKESFTINTQTTYTL